VTDEIRYGERTMSANAPITIQWKPVSAKLWHTYAISGVPVALPVKIRIEVMHAALASEVQALLTEIESIVREVKGEWSEARLMEMERRASDAESLLEVIVSDGVQPFPGGTLHQRIKDALKLSSYDHVWVLPCMQRTDNPETMPNELRK
jgi:hypothetical protein